jgi:hypothetical protein
LHLGGASRKENGCEEGYQVLAARADAVLAHGRRAAGAILFGRLPLVAFRMDGRAAMQQSYGQSGAGRAFSQ